MRPVSERGPRGVRRFVGVDAREWRVHRDTSAARGPGLASRAWLAFECDDGERRCLGAAPGGWEVLSDDVLRLALGAAHDDARVQAGVPRLTLVRGGQPAAPRASRPG
jgi:hypothetical protein